MAATVISAEVFNGTSGSITVPSLTTAVYFFWGYYFDGSGHSASPTLASASPSETVVVTGTSVSDAAGCAAWYSPGTGSKTLVANYSATTSEGPCGIVVYVKDGNVTAWRDADADAQASADPTSVTLTTESGDLVIKYDYYYNAGGTPPSLSSGWTNISTTSNNSNASRASYISASGTTQAADSEDENYSAVIAIAIPAGAGGGSIVPQAMANYRMRAA